MSPNNDLEQVMQHISTPALILVSEQIARGNVRSGNFNHCLMHYLSFATRGRYRVRDKKSFVCWIRSLCNESEAADLELAARVAL